MIIPAALWRNQAEAKGKDRSQLCPVQCKESAALESFFETLKGESLHAKSLVTVRHVQKRIEDYIDDFYNNQRLEIGCRYRISIEFEKIV